MEFSYVSKYLDESDYDYSEKRQILELAALALLGFMLPFAIGAPQILIGILVNALISDRPSACLLTKRCQ